MDWVDPSLQNLEGLNLSIFQLLDKENPGCEKEYSAESEDTGNWLKKKSQRVRCQILMAHLCDTVQSRACSHKC